MNQSNSKRAEFSAESFMIVVNEYLKNPEVGILFCKASEFIDPEAKLVLIHVMKELNETEVIDYEKYSTRKARCRGLYECLKSHYMGSHRNVSTRQHLSICTSVLAAHLEYLNKQEKYMQEHMNMIFSGVME